MNTPIQCSDNANTTTGTNHTNSTIHSLPVEVIGFSLSLLAKHGHFRYAPLACKTCRNAYSNFVSEDTITRAESVVSSISCAKQFFEDVGTDTEQLFSFGKMQQNVVVSMSWNGPIGRDTPVFGRKKVSGGFAGGLLVPIFVITLQHVDNLMC